MEQTSPDDPAGLWISPHSYYRNLLAHNLALNANPQNLSRMHGTPFRDADFSEILGLALLV